MKVALVKPGTPFQIVTNVETKRKTEVMIGFNQEERVYCGTCLNLFTKKPHNTYGGIRRLLGRDLDHPLVQHMVEKENLPNSLYMNESTGRLSFVHEKGKDNEAFFTVHELVSMIFTYAKDIAIDYGEGVKVRDCVVTVPSFFVQKERQAVLDAAHMAGLKVLSLIDENTAAALQYGIDRVFENKTHNVLYYNLGSNSLQVSIVAYGSRTIKEGLSKNVTIGTFEVIGKAFDQHVGGMHFTHKLQNHMADLYNEKKLGFVDDIRTVPRPFAKLKADAQKVKTVLSANKAKSSSFPSFYKDKDFSLTVKRTDFEEMSKDLFDNLTPAIDRALASAKLTLEDIDDVEMLGGGVRIPKVQEILKEYFGEKELGVHLNGDEAMALGSAFYAANLSTAFRVRRVGMTDMSPFAIGVRFTDLEKEEGAEKKWTKRATIFKKNNKLDSRKVVAFQHDRDISVTFNYDSKDDLPEGSEPQIAVYNVSGIAKFAAEMNEKNLSVPKVQLTFMLDASSMVRVMKAEATVEEIIPAKELNITDDAANATDAATDAATDETDAADDATADADSNSTDANETDTNSTDSNSTANDTKPVKPKATKKVHRVQLTIERTDTNMLSEDEMAISKEK
jgi:hypoxia up-regulated 1